MPKADFCRLGQRVEQPKLGASLPVSLCLTLALVTVACADSSASEGQNAQEVSSLVEAVVGGETADACEWPSTVSVNAWGSCSGTLIHPRVVTTAAHCIEDGKSTIYFGASRSTPGAFSLDARCEVGADGSRGANTSKDWAYCILPEDARVAKIPVTPPLVGCEADKYLKAGMEAWVVGFGTTSTVGTGAGVKRQVSVSINALNKAAQGTIDVGDAEQGACHGDSGGPLYVHVKDGEHDWGYRVVGSTSGAGERVCDCNCSTVYVNIANHVKAIEEKEKIDVTPCTDATGKFDPSAACSSLMTAPQDGTGTFPACTVAHTSETIDSCSGTPVATGASGAGAAAGSGGRASAQAGSGGIGSQPRAAGANGSTQAGVSGGAASSGLDIMSAVGVATKPGAAFGATSTSSSAGRAAIGSSVFGTTAAGGPAEQSEPASDGGCQVIGVGSARAHTPLWFAALSFCCFGLARTRRRQAR